MKSEIHDRYVTIVESYVLQLDPIKRKRKIPVREVIQGVLIILTDGVAWRRLRPSIGSYQTYFHYWSKWSFLGIFKRIEDDIRLAYVTYKLDQNHDFKEIYTDTSLVKNRLGWDNLGKNPCDRGRPGNKIAVLCDDLKAPLSVLVFPANVADQTTVVPLFNHMCVDLIRDNRTKMTVIADRGYTESKELQAALKEFNTELLASKRRNKGEREKKKAPKADRDKLKYRYKIEHFNSRFKQFRRLDKRYERCNQTFVSFFEMMSGGA